LYINVGQVNAVSNVLNSLECSCPYISSSSPITDNKMHDLDPRLSPGLLVSREATQAATVQEYCNPLYSPTTVGKWFRGSRETNGGSFRERDFRPAAKQPTSQSPPNLMK
ncbi:hypothetical protein V1477_010250, partial [Vespula maculifrons]